MRISMLLSGWIFPPHIRIENEAERLLADGHQVFVICNGDKKRPNNEVWQGIRIIRINNLFKPLHLLNASLRFTIFRHFHWELILGSLIKQHKFDALHVHDLPLAASALISGSRFNIPVVLDLHENWPVIMKAVRKVPSTIPERFAHYLFYNLDRWKAYEKQALSKAARVIVVAPEAADRVVALGAPQDRIVLVSNTLNIPHFESFALHRDILQKYAGKFVISYVGTVSRFRRLDTLIAAMPIVMQTIPNAHLVIVGNRQRYPDLESLVDSLGLRGSVRFEGWQPFENVPSYIYAADVGILPHQPDEHLHTTLPHKLFQYMYAAKPIVETGCLASKRIVQEYQCGVIADGGADNPKVLAEAIISLKDEATRHEMGQRGRQAVIDKYNFTIDAQCLSSMYSQLAQEKEMRQ
jgi:glycosyltransferase involved in cell wall biosynthesis